jgi:hypothetical protein
LNQDIIIIIIIIIIILLLELIFTLARYAQHNPHFCWLGTGKKISSVFHSKHEISSALTLILYHQMFIERS